MYVLTGKGEVTGFAVDWVEKYGIQHLCNVYLPEKTSCWTFTEDDYTAMGEPDLEALEPDGKADFITVGKEAWEAQNVERFKSDKETWQTLYPELFIEETESGSEDKPDESGGDRTPEETGTGDGEIIRDRPPVNETIESSTSRECNTE